MTRLKTLAVLALATLVASTSMASALTLKPNLVIPVGPGNASSGVVYVPIKVDPVQKPNIPYIPIDFEPAKPAKPHIPIIPGVIDVLNDDPVQSKPMLLVDCMVKDTAPTTNDFWIVNVGEAELPAGLKIRFAVPSTGDHGAFLLNRSVASGARAKVADLLHGAQSGAPCRAQIL